MADHNVEEQFKKDVLKAKAKYRKRRKVIILGIMTLVLMVTLVQTFFYIREKKQINTQLEEQSQQIENLEKEAKVNDVVIDRLKDPYFITDLVRQEYGLSYGGEIIFSLPLQDSFLKAAINAIKDGSLEKKDDGSGRIDDSKLSELNKDSKETEGKDSKKDKKSEKTKSESSDDSSEDAEENNKTITANNTQTKNTDKKKNRG